MGRYKEDIQDSITRQMEKANRRSDRKADDISLASQLKRAEAYDKLTVEQKRAAVPAHIWTDELGKYMVDKRKITTRSIFNTITMKYRKELEEFHSSGTPFGEILSFIEEKTNYLSNL